MYCFDGDHRLELRQLLFRVVGGVEDRHLDAFWALATLFAAASMGASYVFATANDRYAT